MKKLLVILLLFGAFVNQSEAKIQVGVGINAGPCFGRWNNKAFGSKLATAGGTLGYQIGAHAAIQGRIWFNKFVGINLGGEFNMGGSKFIGTKGTIVTHITHKENQITLPLTALVGWGNERLRIYAQAGGFFAYAISGTDQSTINNDGSVVSNGSTKADYKNVYKNIDAGVRLGGGVQVYVDKKLKSCVTFDINYDLGFMNTFRGTAPAYFNNPEKLRIMNSKLMIGVGFLYTFGKSQAEEAPKRVTAPEEE